jgi:hypothetical protein
MAIFLSLDSSSEAMKATLWIEVELTVGTYPDPLEILLQEESDEFDSGFAVQYLTGIHRAAHGRGCSFPQCYQPCRSCKRNAQRDRQAR